MESLMKAKDLQAEIGHEEDSFAAYWIVLASCMCHVFSAVCMCSSVAFSRSNTSRPRPATLKSVDFSFKIFSACRLQRFAAILECQGAQEVHGIHKLQVCWEGGTHMKIDTSQKRRGQRFLPNQPPALSAGRCEHVFGKGAWRQVGVSLSYLWHLMAWRHSLMVN